MSLNPNSCATEIDYGSSTSMCDIVACSTACSKASVALLVQYYRQGSVSSIFFFSHKWVLDGVWLWLLVFGWYLVGWLIVAV